MIRNFKFYWVALAFLVLGCSQPKFINDQAYSEQVLLDFQAKERSMQLGGYFEDIRHLDMNKAEQEAMMFLYAYMPSADITDYPASYFLDNVQLTFEAQKEMPWGDKIPEELIRHFVLPIRVNNENLDTSRVVFYHELKDRVKGLSMKDAILEVNHWCHEKVVYQPSDARTSSPLASVKTAYGRCGEESTFTVAALRSVGIPARQVYTPRWAHTDNNHAWVEAWADGEWYFFGACEPEPVLNLGWFNSPASRGMLMHTKVFGKYTGKEEIMTENMNFTEINVIENYAPAAKAEVLVVDENDKPVSGAKVEFKLYNYAEFYTVASKFTNGEGLTFLTAGKGDMIIWAHKGDKFGLAKCSFGKDNTVKVVLNRDEHDSYTIDFDIVPPVESVNLPEVTPAQRAENDRLMAQEDSIRKAYIATFVTEDQAKSLASKWGLNEARVVKYLIGSRGNHQTLVDFLNEAVEEEQGDLALELLEVVSAKDLRDVSLDVLNDHLYNTLLPKELSVEAYREILNPRVEYEMITPYKAYFQEVIDEDDAKSFRANPLALVDWISENITIFNELNAQRIRISPRGVYESRLTDDISRDIFFVSVARSLGIPAWKDGVTGKIQYRNLETNAVFDVDFDTIEEKQAPQGTVIASYKPSKTLLDPKYYTHFTISKFNNGIYQPLSFNAGENDMGEGATWSNLLKNGLKLDTGSYMLITGTRMADGSVLSYVNFFEIKEGETTKIDLIMRQSTDAVQVIGDFNSESRYLPLGAAEEQSILQTTGRGYFVVGILGVGQEPTNHALRDIAAVSKELEAWGKKMVLLFPTQQNADKFNKNEFAGLPSTISYGIDVDSRIQKEIVGAMKLNPSSLPVFIIADTFNRVVFVSQGYTIGLGEQLMKVINGL